MLASRVVLLVHDGMNSVGYWGRSGPCTADLYRERPASVPVIDRPAGTPAAIVGSRSVLKALVGQENRMGKLKPGDRAPSFTLTDQEGKLVTLSHFGGRKLILYFYPKADTPGCTKQACSIRDSVPDLKEAGLAAVGISPDSPEKQKKFDRKHGLGFPLLSDEDHAVAEAYGAWGEKKMYGKSYEGIIRSSFLIDEKGKIIDSWYKIRPEETVPKAKKALASYSR